MGIIISYPLTLLIDQILPTAMPISVIMIAIFISLMVGVISGFLPANRASKMDPVDALRLVVALAEHAAITGAATAGGPNSEPVSKEVISER